MTAQATADIASAFGGRFQRLIDTRPDYTGYYCEYFTNVAICGNTAHWEREGAWSHSRTNDEPNYVCDEHMFQALDIEPTAREPEPAADLQAADSELDEWHRKAWELTAGSRIRFAIKAQNGAGGPRNLHRRDLPAMLKLFHKLGYTVTAVGSILTVVPVNPLTNASEVAQRRHQRFELGYQRTRLREQAEHWRATSSAVRANYQYWEVVEATVGQLKDLWPELIHIWGHDETYKITEDARGYRPPHNTIAVAFWPVCFQDEAVHGLTTPGTFVIDSKGNVQPVPLDALIGGLNYRMEAQVAPVHPHQYQDGHLCVGPSARFGQGLLLALHDLRSWWTSTDLRPANPGWNADSLTKWASITEAFFSKYPEAKYIKAPRSSEGALGLSETVPLLPDMLSSLLPVPTQCGVCGRAIAIGRPPMHLFQLDEAGNELEALEERPLCSRCYENLTYERARASLRRRLETREQAGATVHWPVRASSYVEMGRGPLGVCQWPGYQLTAIEGAICERRPTWQRVLMDYRPTAAPNTICAEHLIEHYGALPVPPRPLEYLCTTCWGRAVIPARQRETAPVPTVCPDCDGPTLLRLGEIPSRFRAYQYHQTARRNHRRRGPHACTECYAEAKWRDGGYYYCHACVERSGGSERRRREEVLIRRGTLIRAR